MITLVYCILSINFYKRALWLVLQAVNLSTFWPEIHGLYLREVSVKERILILMMQLQNVKEEYIL